MGRGPSHRCAVSTVPPPVELDLFLIKANGLDSLFGPKEDDDTLEESWELIEVRRACSKVLLC
jgi:hypothetical protein